MRRSEKRSIEGYEVDGPNIPPPPPLPAEFNWMRDDEGNILSLVQCIEAVERDALLRELNENVPTNDFAADYRMTSHEGQNHGWVNVPPLKHRGYNLENHQFLLALKRRFGLDLIGAVTPCPCCGSLMDKKGEHMLKCKHGPTTATWRHNTVRDFFAKWIRRHIGNCGIEHGGGLATEE